ncbi:hypothetical protein [Streptomyces chartreusis]|uniref:hypothetical protein n=1 Tax=Streptomyces chartreusis TaxID=1969 RepID=UPI0036299C52
MDAITSSSPCSETSGAPSPLLLEAGAADGTLKPDLDPEDVLLQLSVLWRIDPARGGTDRSARILTLIVDGLRTRRP